LFPYFPHNITERSQTVSTFRIFWIKIKLDELLISNFYSFFILLRTAWSASKFLRRIYTSGFLMRFPHCVSIFYYLPWLSQTKVSYEKLQPNAVNACGNRMCKLSFSYGSRKGSRVIKPRLHGIEGQWRTGANAIKKNYF